MDFDERAAVKAHRVTLLNEWKDEKKGPMTGRYDGSNEVVRLRRSNMPDWEVMSVVVSVKSGLVCSGRVLQTEERQKGMAQYAMLEIHNEL